MAQFILLILLLCCSVQSLPYADRLDAVSLNLTDSSEIPWHHTEGYELTEEEVRTKNDIVLAKWGLSGSDLAKRSEWADHACAELNGWGGHDYEIHKPRVAECVLPGRRPWFHAHCAVWTRNGIPYHADPMHDTQTLGRCPALTVCDLSRSCENDIKVLVDLSQRPGKQCVWGR